MDFLFILVAVPVSFVASVVYRFAVLFGQTRWPGIKLTLLWASYAILTLIVVDWTLLALWGAVGTRTTLGPFYEKMTGLTFFFGPPALINVLVLPDPDRKRARWFLAVPLATASAFFLLMEVVVSSEAFYGVEGSGGPFSESAHPTP